MIVDIVKYVVLFVCVLKFIGNMVFPYQLLKIHKEVKSGNSDRSSISLGSILIVDIVLFITITLLCFISGNNELLNNPCKVALCFAGIIFISYFHFYFVLRLSRKGGNQ